MMRQMATIRLLPATSLIHVLVAGTFLASFIPGTLQAPLHDVEQYSVLPMETDHNGVPLAQTGSSQDGRRVMLNSEDTRRYFTLHGYKERLMLNLTVTGSHLLPSTHVVVVQHHHEGGVKEEEKEIDSSELQDCLHSGVVQRQDDGTAVGWAAVSTCNGMQGLIGTDTGLYTIEPFSDDGRHERDVTKQLHLLRPHNQLLTSTTATNTQSEKRSQCYTGDHIDNLKVGQGQRRSRRHQHSVSQKTIEVAVVVDKLTADHHGTDTLPYVLTLMNVVSYLFNDPSAGDVIRLALVKVIILESYPAGFPTTSFAPVLRNEFCQWQSRLQAPHHDIAVLLTRRSICEGGLTNCGVLGITHIGGICNPVRSCAVVKDTGLSTVFTVAHELGHSLGLHHDGDQPNGCASGYHIMAPSFSSSSNPHFWSHCSKKHLQEFLRSEGSSCLNDEPNTTVAPPPAHPPLPGMEYTLDEQCQLLFGAGASHCNTTIRQDQCRRLWCATNTTTGCVTQHSPPSPGTPCLLANSTSGVCYRGNCERYSVVMQPIHGQWSGWSGWSLCSMPCGVGVQHSNRKCDSPSPAYGGAHCLGIRRRYRTCNTHACPSGSKSYRQQMCENLRPSGRVDEWEPVSNAIVLSSHLNPCDLHCQMRGSNIIHTLTSNVSDGASCLVHKHGRYEPGVCTNRQCVSVGCDGQLNSPGRYDQCGVWCGNNDTCRSVTGEYSHHVVAGSNVNREYVDVVVIPKGSRNIKITKTTPSINRIAVRSTSPIVRLNALGHTLSSLPYPRMLYLANSWWKYLYNTTHERLVITGPISATIVAQIMFTSGHASLHYSFTSPLSGYTSSTSSNLFSLWQVGNWSDCSVECGEGSQHRQVKCVDRHGVSVSEGMCKPITKPVNTMSCTRPACEQYHWSVGNWSECSVSCGSGTQSRVVQCRSTDSQQLVTDSYCSDIPAPTRMRNCSLSQCSVWVYKPWSQCSVSCGNGVKEQRPMCQSVTGGVASTSCDPAQRPPVLHQNCSGSPCVSPPTSTTCTDSYIEAVCRSVKSQNLCSIQFFHNLCCRTCESRRK